MSRQFWRIARLAAVLPLILLANSAFALACQTQSGAQHTLSQSFPISYVRDDLAPGSVIWTSPVQTVSVYCYFDGYERQDHDEPIYFYPNPRKVTPVANAEFGVLYRGVTYWGGDRINTGYKTGGWYFPRNVNFDLQFQIVMRKIGAGPVGAATVSNYDEWQIDGEQGLNANTGVTLVYQITSLSNLKPSTCQVTLSSTPAVVDFGSVMVNALNTGGTKTVPFALAVTGTNCSTAMNVDLLFSTNENTVDNKYIVPAGNTGIGILLKDGSGKEITFNTANQVASGWKGSTINYPVQAIVKAMTTPVKEGAFAATATVMVQFR